MKPLRLASALRRDTGGIALTEFAIAFPIVLALGMYGIDTANFALTHLKLNQIALNLADNASRVGSTSTLATQQMREVDVEDVFQAAKTQGQAIKLTENGRVILSSLEKDSAGVQRIHWQRCFGSKTGAVYESHYGKVKNTDGKAEVDSNNNGKIDTNEYQFQGQAKPTGMGATGGLVNAPTSNSGVMFVEINYHYKPLFGWLSSPDDLRYVASFVVRDPRDFSQLYNPTNLAGSKCGYADRSPI